MPILGDAWRTRTWMWKILFMHVTSLSCYPSAWGNFFLPLPGDDVLQFIAKWVDALVNKQLACQLLSVSRSVSWSICQSLRQSVNEAVNLSGNQSLAFYFFAALTFELMELLAMLMLMIMMNMMSNWQTWLHISISYWQFSSKYEHSSLI